ncbi:GntR family transcriptional regulator [Phytohabitans suffuscus]|uniref:GntR family transcriptional regulator n=1 Tax=Phytohabitans suffuscus TaxID=624315 RepID=A0A6F8YZ30_9ACTN|nr:GntR family transcriptional regulator [Phytohabitans suffuscus]BCB91326.1 GntR family transcriptional regulator [Phytohabitans suffuscus]
MTVTTPRTAHSYAYESLRARILSGELPPGTALIQANLARDLGVSMTPVREALRNLATEGLVTMSTHRGATVTQLDLEDAKEIYRIRLQLEPSAASMAVLEADSRLLDEADKLIDRMADTSGAEWIALNQEFHGLLLSPARSPRLLSILRSLQEAATLYVGVAMAHRRAPSPETEHRAILDAYRRRDPTAAAAAVADHILSSLKSLEPEDEAKAKS